MSHTVVILGGSYAGVKVAHSLLKSTLPTVKDLKVILVNPSPKFFWNMATVRAIVPGQIKDEQLFRDIAPGFRYAGEAFEFVQGTAEALDTEAKSVQIKTESGQRTQTYDKLVIATGSRADSNTPWKHGATHEQTLEDLHETQRKVAAAKTIVVGGGGTTGTETAGELAFEYGTKKEITIINSGATLMAANMTPAINTSAAKHLESMGVKVLLSTRIVSSEQTTDGRTELTLSSGERKTVDLYLPTTGLTPNTSFVPTSMLNDKQEIKTDTFFRAASNPDIYALGDCSALERSGILIALNQCAALQKILDADLRGLQAAEYKVPTSEMMAVTLGRRTGTGYAMGWKLPGFVVWLAKGRTLSMEKMGPLLSQGKM